MVKKYRKLPVEIEAIQLNWKNWDLVCEFIGDKFKINGQYDKSNNCSDACDEYPPYIELVIPTLEGNMLAKHGDYIIKGVSGEFYPCKPDIFNITYEEVK